VSRLFQVKSFFNYWLDAVDEHSLHSPFLFQLSTSILKKQFTHPELAALRTLKRQLENDDRTLSVTDYGAGSIQLKNPERKISQIARTSVSDEKFSLLYCQLIQHWQCKHVLELGTSLGINTLYMATGNPLTRVVTFEGSPEIASIARENTAKFKLENIHIIEGNINDTLPDYLSSSPDIDFVFIDANHRYVPTLQYFERLIMKSHEQSIIIVDDIHYSREMEDAWRTILTNPKVYTTVDLYRCGLIFFNPALTKQNVVLQF